MRTGVVQFVLASISGFLVLCWAVPRTGRLLTSWLDAHSVALDVEAEVEYDSATDDLDALVNAISGEEESDETAADFRLWEAEYADRNGWQQKDRRPR